MKISVIIATKDRFDDTQKCVESILMQTLLPNELVIVDSSDKIGLEEILSKQISGKIAFRYLHTKPGLTYQRNRGIEVAQGDIVCFFDDDVIIKDNYIKTVAEFFVKNPQIGGVTGKIVNQDDMKPLSKLYRRIFCLSEISKGEVKPSWSNNAISTTVKNPIEVDWLQGANQIYNAKVFTDELFDEKMKGYCYMEDVDFSYRVKKRHKIYYLPDAQCVHNHKSSPATRMKKREKQYMFMINYHYLFKKNMKQTFKNLFCHYWSFLGFLVRGIFFERNLDFTIGTIKGIWANLTGGNQLIKGRK